jgi:hypothetical protein
MSIADLHMQDRHRKEQSKTHYYLPGSNATLFLVRRERNYDPNEHGNGDITDFEGTAKEVFHALDKLRTISALIGNVDHSQGNGSKSAKMRGDLLNDIRAIIEE